MPEPCDSARLDALEERIAHQDSVIEDLNATVTDLWTRIEALTRRLVVLDDRLQEAESRAGEGVPSPPPPHY